MFFNMYILSHPDQDVQTTHRLRQCSWLKLQHSIFVNRNANHLCIYVHACLLKTNLQLHHITIRKDHIWYSLIWSPEEDWETPQQALKNYISTIIICSQPVPCRHSRLQQLKPHPVMLITRSFKFRDQFNKLFSYTNMLWVPCWKWIFTLYT